MGTPSSMAAVQPPFSLLFIPSASNIKAFLFMALLQLVLPGSQGETHLWTTLLSKGPH